MNQKRYEIVIAYIRISGIPIGSGWYWIKEYKGELEIGETACRKRYTGKWVIP